MQWLVITLIPVCIGSHPWAKSTHEQGIWHVPLLRRHSDSLLHSSRVFMVFEDGNSSDASELEEYDGFNRWYLVIPVYNRRNRSCLVASQVEKWSHLMNLNIWIQYIRSWGQDMPQSETTCTEWSENSHTYIAQTWNRQCVSVLNSYACMHLQITVCASIQVEVVHGQTCTFGLSLFSNFSQRVSL